MKLSTTRPVRTQPKLETLFILAFHIQLLMKFTLMSVLIIISVKSIGQVQFRPYQSMYVNPRSIEISQILRQRYYAHYNVVANAANVALSLTYDNLNAREKSSYSELVDIINYCIERGDYENLGTQCIRINGLLDSLYPDCADLSNEIIRRGDHQHSLSGQSSFVKGLYCYKYFGAWYIIVDFQRPISGELGKSGKSSDHRYVYCGFSDTQISTMISEFRRSNDLSYAFNNHVRNYHVCRCK
jgi:hypothetical protein